MRLTKTILPGPSPELEPGMPRGHTPVCPRILFSLQFAPPSALRCHSLFVGNVSGFKRTPNFHGS
jgi:hypothetical protein